MQRKEISIAAFVEEELNSCQPLNSFFTRLMKIYPSKGLTCIKMETDEAVYAINKATVFSDFPGLTYPEVSSAFIFLSGTENLKRELRKIAIAKNIPFIVYEPDIMTPESCIDQVVVSISEKINFRPVNDMEYYENNFAPLPSPLPAPLPFLISLKNIMQTIRVRFP